MRQVRYFVEYVLLSGVGLLARLVPRRWALFLGTRLGDFGYYCLPLRRGLVTANLKSAFPEKSTREIRRIARGVYRNFAITVVEHLRLTGMSQSDLLEIVNLEGEEIIKEAFARGKGVVFAAGHFGNWEYMVSSLSASGYQISAVTADINNTFVDSLIRANRTRMGVPLFAKKGSGPEILNTLNNNEGLALLMDQDARRRGVFVDFMGRPASTPKGPAKLALTQGAALLFVIPRYNQDMSITTIIKKIDTEHFTETNPDNIKTLTQICTHTLEEYVRRFPEQWFWLHRRWKTRPPGESGTQ